MAETSIIGPQVTITGTLISSADVTVEGKVDGNIHASGQVVVEKGGNVMGTVYAEQATIRGQIEGAIHARKVQLTATGRIKGDIVHARMTMEDGAILDGYCRHSDNPVHPFPAETHGPGLGQGVRARTNA